jgi:hypothetical protein
MRLRICATLLKLCLLSAGRQLPEGYAVVCEVALVTGAEHETETLSSGEHYLRVAVRSERGRSAREGALPSGGTDAVLVDWLLYRRVRWSN